MHHTAGFPGTMDRISCPFPFRILFCLLIVLAVIAPVSAALGTGHSGSAATGSAQFTDPAEDTAGLFTDENYLGPWTLVNTRFGWTSRSGQTVAAMPDDKGIDPFAEIDEKLAPDEAAALKLRIQNTLHAFSYDDATGTWYARNAANQLTFTYMNDGTAKFSDPEYSFGLTLAGIGRDGPIAPATSGVTHADGRQLNITRGEYTEWYRNNDNGVEQGVTLTSRPPGTGPLQIRFRFTGDGFMSLGNGQALTITNASGTPLFEYAGLHAFSADGRKLPASLDTDGSTLSWLVDDTGAVYPVTIDPVIVSDSVANARFTSSAAGDVFGWSVALSSEGTRVLVGAQNNDIAGSDAGAAYLFDKPAGGWSGTTSALAATATFTGGAATDQFGRSVSLSSDGTRALIGAHYNDTVWSNAGAVYLFNVPAGSGPRTISASAANATFTGGANGDEFGNSVAISPDGTRALIGAQYNDTAGSNAGAAYLFDVPAGSGPQIIPVSAATARFTGGNESDEFGNSVALSVDGTRVLVGAHYNNTAGNKAGDAYIFNVPTGGGPQIIPASAATARFTGGAGSDQFGYSVALSSDGIRALIGAPYSDTAGNDVGAAYIFDKPALGWSGTTSASGANATFTGRATATIYDSYFGYSVSFSSAGTKALIGSFDGWIDSGGWEQTGGAAFLFDKPSSGWSGTTSASAASATFKGSAGSDRLGWSVALSSEGTRALVGAPINGTVGSLAGAAYLFQPPYATLTAGGTTAGTAGTVVNGLTLNPTGTLTNIDLYLGTDATTPTGTAIKTGISLPATTTTTVNSVNLNGKTGGTYYLIATENGTASVLGATSAKVFTVTATQPPSGGDSDSVNSATSGTAASIATSPGAAAGQTMSFNYPQNPALNSPLQITRIDMVPSQNVGPTDLLVASVSLGTVNQPAGIPAVVGYREIEPMGINPTIFTNGVISFQVSGAWITEHQTTPAQVTMLRNHDGVWASLPTTYTGQNGNYYTYTATTPGFSYFAVAVRNETALPASPAAAVETMVTTPAGSITIPTPAPSSTTRTTVPVPTETTAVPAVPTGNSGMPVSTVITGAVAIVLIVGGGLLIRRWWIRRQNPALFRDYE